MPNTAYQDLEAIFHRISLITETIGVLYWDAATVMPEKGSQARSEQLAELKNIAHNLLISDKIEGLIQEAETKIEALNIWQRKNLNEMHSKSIRARAIPRDLVVAHSKACFSCETTWRNALKDDNYSLVKPFLQEVLNLSVQIGEAKAAVLNCSLYNALIDSYDPGSDHTEIDKVFKKYEQIFPNFLNEVLEVQKSETKPILYKKPVPAKVQKQLSIKLMSLLGIKFDGGRLDSSAHPFCGGIPEDIRITTRYDNDNFTSGLMGVLHETGHALYEMGLPKKWRRQPVGEAMGMSIHESQSLLIEMQVCRSRQFLNWVAPIIRRTFNQSGKEWSGENLHKIFTRVQPTFIRVDADEVTYPAHVILRYRLEKALINKSLNLGDLPLAWNDGMKSLLGITPMTNKEGCLQDIHWFDGAWGYFPSYTLGAMSAAQFFSAACDSKKEIPNAISKGDFSHLQSWLIDNIHCKGRFFTTPELMKNVTGEHLNPSYFIDHLKTRYLSQI